MRGKCDLKELDFLFLGEAKKAFFLARYYNKLI